MSRRSGLLLAAAAWLALILGTSTAVWAVIDAAGHRVTASASLPATGRVLPAAASPSADPQRPGRRSGGAKPTVRPGRPARHSAVPLPASATPSAGARPGTTAPVPPVPAPPRRSPHASPSSPAPPPPAPASEQRTWQGSSGNVVAACSGASISLRGALANTGWRVQVENRGPQTVQVHFERSDDSAEVQLVGTCSQGAPGFTTSARDG